MTQDVIASTIKKVFYSIASFQVEKLFFKNKNKFRERSRAFKKTFQTI